MMVNYCELFTFLSVSNIQILNFAQLTFSRIAFWIQHNFTTRSVKKAFLELQPDAIFLKTWIL